MSSIPAFGRFCLRTARRVLRLLCWITLQVAVVLIAAFLLYNKVEGSKWESYRKDAAARGILLDLPKDHAAPIPDRDNFAAAAGPFAPKSAASQQDWLPDFQGLPLHFPSLTHGTRMTIAQAYAEGATPAKASDAAPRPELNESKAAEDFLALCDQRFGGQWPAILEVEARPKSQVTPAATILPRPRSFSPLMARKVAQVHEMRAMAFFDLHRDDEAFDEVEGILRIVRGVQAADRKNLTTHMIATAILGLGLTPIWEGLVDRHWSEGQLATLEKELAAFHPVDRWTETMDSERQWENAVYDHLVTASFAERVRNFQDIFKAEFLVEQSAEKTLGPARMFALITCSTGVIRHNQLYSNQSWDLARQWISADGQWHPELISTFLAFGNLNRAERTEYAIAALLATAAQRALCRVIVIEAQARQARLGIALERYRRQHGDLPEKLDALAPEFIEAIPIDPINNAPIRYTRETNASFTLRCPDHGPYGEMKIGDVFDGDKVNGKTDIVWHGLEPESRREFNTAAP